MTADESAKVLALQEHVRVPEFAYGARLVRNLCWRMKYNPGAPLSPVEKWLLDQCCWHYRNKLGGLVTFDLPESKPALTDYLPRSAAPQQRPLL